VHYAQQADLLVRAPDAVGVGTPFQQLLAFSAVFWFVALVTATFSAINERELRRRRYDLEALARMAARLDDARDPREVADVVADAVTETFDFRRAVVLFAPEGEALALAAHRGATEVPHGAAPGTGSAVAEALSTRSTQFVARLDPAADPWLDAMLPDARNLILLPLASGERTVGVLAAEYPLGGGARIQRRVVSMVERFTSHGTLALRNAWLLEDARRRAATDGLTGLANRRTFDNVLDQELERAARGGDDVSLVLFDIDHFKRVNDAHGHQTGDDVLRRVASVFASTCRVYDTAARYGGEEIAVILPRTPSDDAALIAERLRLAIEALPDHPRVTASAGVATYPLGAADAAALIAAADRALYVSKANGRNRVTLAGDTRALAA
jgi:diguanylate cyclase (GGDEF)-like protein